jgi:hypothetical protein
MATAEVEPVLVALTQPKGDVSCARTLEPQEVRGGVGDVGATCDTGVVVVVAWGAAEVAGLVPQ